jgi:hypothetical protein
VLFRPLPRHLSPCPRGELARCGMVEEVPVLQPPHNIGNNRNALLRDPDGNLVEIVAKVS